MIIPEILIWWYSTGWHTFLRKIGQNFSRITDFFSMSSLIRTLFKPFRQISAESAGINASLDLKFHMFIDRLVSRFVGFFSRLFLLLTGTIIIVLGSIFGFVFLVLWPFLPLTPIAGIILTIMGITL